MTMYLLQKCLIKSTNENLLPASEEEVSKIKDLVLKIENVREGNRNMDSVISHLSAEDPSVSYDVGGHRFI